MLSQSHLKRILNYDKDSGIFTWNIDTNNQVSIGDIAGSISGDYGYVRIVIDYKEYKAHRLAWLYLFGYMPEQVDHINHNGSDNRICNLRECDNKENMKNKSLYKNNKSGISGVSYYKPYDKWLVRINDNGKRISLGYFENLDEAIAVRKQAEIQYKYHKNHGKERIA